MPSEFVNKVFKLWLGIQMHHRSHANGSEWIERSLFVLFGGPEKGRLGRWVDDGQMSLTSESVQGASLPLESIDDIHGGDGLPLGVFGVGDGIPDDVLKENLEDSTGLFIDESRDTLDSSTAS